MTLRANEIITPHDPTLQPPRRVLLAGQTHLGLLVSRLQRLFDEQDLACKAENVDNGSYAEMPQVARDAVRVGGRAPIIVLFPDGRTALADVRRDPRRFAREPASGAAVGTAAAAAFVGVAESAAIAAPGATVVLATYAPPGPGSWGGVADPMLDPTLVAARAFNASLSDAVAKRNGWVLLDLVDLSSRIGSAAFHDARLELHAHLPWSSAGLNLIARRLAALLNAIEGRAKKVLLLDADNTLWGGVVGEDGVDGLQIGEDGVGGGYLRFQEALSLLESRGILLALVSRNNPGDVRAVFTGRAADMRLNLSQFAAVATGWGAKSDSILRVAAKLGLPPESMVFVDDNPAERAEVRRALPGVSVPEDFPTDPADLPQFAYELSERYFLRITIGATDTGRTALYQLRSHLHCEPVPAVGGAAGAAGQDRGAFLASLDMHATLAADDPQFIARNAELTQKTNQFNLTLRRYTAAEMRALTEDPNALVVAGSLRDRFGDHGSVAVAVLVRAGAGWSLDVLAVSCRVLGRGFEQAFLAACVGRARAVQVGPVQACFTPGPKNGQLRDWLDTAGFHRTADRPDGGRKYELTEGQVLDLPEAAFTSIEWEYEHAT